MEGTHSTERREPNTTSICRRDCLKGGDHVEGCSAAVLKSNRKALILRLWPSLVVPLTMHSSSG
jgi:hypothetical protein